MKKNGKADFKKSKQKKRPFFYKWKSLIIFL